MKTKWILAALLALILTTGAVIGVQAATGDQPNLPAARPGSIRAQGIVGDTAADSFTLQTRRGDLTFAIDSQTSFHSPTGEADQGDLEEDVRAGVLGIRHADDSLTARVVVIIPADFDVREFRGTSLRGEVWSIASDGSGFTVEQANGEEVFIQVTGATSFVSPSGLINSLADLQVHDRVVVTLEDKQAGDYVAVQIAARPRTTRHAGEINAIDLAAGTLTLARRDGTEITFELTGSTEVSGGQGSLDSLDDLQPGMLAIIAARESDNGYIAMRIGARP